MSEKMNIGIDKTITADEVINLRAVSGWDADFEEWKKCLSQNLINVSARDGSGQLVGAGFLTGNVRHAELVDLVVHPDYRQKGIGRSIVRIIVDYAKQNKIKYFGLTYDEESPWLKEFYESEGFQPIDFAMWHEDSL